MNGDTKNILLVKLVINLVQKEKASYLLMLTLTSENIGEE